MAVAAAERQSEGLGEERACVWEQARKRVGLSERPSRRAATPPTKSAAPTAKRSAEEKHRMVVLASACVVVRQVDVR